MEKRPDEIVVLFDGVCNLCNGLVQFIIQRDRDRVFRFASLQSAKAAELTGASGNTDPQTVLAILEGRVYERSDAVLLIASRLPGWGWFRVVRILPAVVRDTIYDLIARNRYRIFGRRNECMIPTKDMLDRFL